jgi:hypothetical protein
MQLTAVTTTAASIPSPAQAWASEASWLLTPGSVVNSIQVLDPRTVRLMVADPFALGHGRAEADRLVADSAKTVLEQAAHGVRLITMTRNGYFGRISPLAPAQLTFLTGLPGVQRYDLVPTDPDRDGIIAPDRFVHLVEADTADDARRLDWLLRDRFDDGSIHAGPVRFTSPVDPWQAAPVRGTR